MVKTCDIARAASVLRAGATAIFETDTVCGIGVSVAHAHSPAALFEAKGRPDGKPVAWLVGAPADLGAFGRRVPAYAYELARAHWPGALTLVVEAAASVPGAFASAEGTIGLRMPDHTGVLALISELGCPLATSSANLSGEPAVATLCDVSPALLERAGCVLEFPVPAHADLQGRASCGADGACASAGSGIREAATPGAGCAPAHAPVLASTVVDCTGARPRLLRAGSVGVDVDQAAR